MGILNVTPDSFADAPPLDARAVVDAALRMEDVGADLLDVGGESTRPGARPVSEDEELARIVPVVRALAGRTTLPVSVDTQKAAVARAALLEGAVIVNDVSALSGDVDMARVVASTGAAVILMHHRGTSAHMYDRAIYTDVAGEVTQELAERLEVAVAAGIPREQTIVDPGIGFAKRSEHSYGVLTRLPEIGRGLSRPLLVGPSRKSFMSVALDNRPATERDWGTAAAVTAAVLGGAHIVRVHAVEEMRQVVRVAEDIRRA
jgi:dihydropteroate synthase